MPVHLFQHGSGRVCRKKLPCSHRCSEGAGSNHVCVCSNKWTFDPGCGHKVTGMCSDYSKIGLPCLEWCGKVLDCGHPCLEPCYSDACICNLCLDMHPVVNSDSDDENKSETQKSSATTVWGSSLIKNHAEILKAKLNPIKNLEFPSAQPKMVVQPTLKLVSSKVLSTRKNRNARFASLQLPAKNVKVPQKAATNGNGFHGLQNGFDKNMPCSSNMAYGNGNANGPSSSKTAYGNTFGSAVLPPKQPQPIKIHNSFKDNGLHMGMNDDNAWKLGYAKCVNAHYFRAELRRCDTCGEKAEYQLPDGYYSDSDSD